MAFHLGLKNAVLPSNVDDFMVNYIFSLLDRPDISDQSMVQKIAALDFTNRIFAADQNGKAREIFLENGIYQKLNGLLKESIHKNDNFSLILSTASLGLVYHLLSVHLESLKVTIPLHFLEYFLITISKNKLDSSVKLAVSCLCLQDWKKFETSNYFINLCGFPTLLEAAKYSTRDITIDIIKIFANFIIDVNHYTKVHLISDGILKYIVEICDSYLQKKIQFGGNADNLLKQCMIFLNNFMYKYFKGKMEFYKLGGMKIISELYFTHPDENFRKIFIERVLRILLYHNSQKEPSDFFSHLDRSGKLTLRKRYPPPLKLVEESLTGSRLQTDIMMLHKSAVQSKDIERSYQIKSVVPFVNDNTHAIMPLNMCISSKINEVGRTACGMLNCQKNCTIYFGINHNKVEGLKMNRHTKDKFRLACDTIFNKSMKPTVYMSSDVNVEFVPVKNGEDVIPDLFLAEIHIRANNDFFSYKNKTYFYYNTTTKLIDAENLQLLVISDENKQWLQKEKKWLKKLDEIKASKNRPINQPAALTS